MRKAKISFEHSPKTCIYYAKIVIDDMSILLIDEDFNKANSTKNNSPKTNLSLEEIMNIIKKSFSDIEDNKHQKRHHKIFYNISTISLTLKRLNNFNQENKKVTIAYRKVHIPKNSQASKNKKYPKVDLSNGSGNLLIKMQ